MRIYEDDDYYIDRFDTVLHGSIYVVGDGMVTKHLASKSDDFFVDFMDAQYTNEKAVLDLLEKILYEGKYSR